MWFMVTEALFVGGAGVAIIGGLYWKKGTTAGAWAGLLSGSSLITSGIIARQIWGDGFPLNGAQIGFFGSISACLIYAVVSLLTCRGDFNMERLLHRGIYAVESEKKFQTKSKKKVIWGKLIGMDDNFTFGDKLLAGGLFGWGMLWTLITVVGTVWNIFAPWSTQTWANYQIITGMGIPIIFALVTAVWFTWGGIRDMREFFRRLKEERVDERDDGTVVNHHNLGEKA
jgi:solute:Na+ symporter, SSS family